MSSSSPTSRLCLSLCPLSTNPDKGISVKGALIMVACYLVVAVQHRVFEDHIGDHLVNLLCVCCGILDSLLRELGLAYLLILGSCASSQSSCPCPPCRSNWCPWPRPHRHTRKSCHVSSWLRFGQTPHWMNVPRWPSSMIAL